MMQDSATELRNAFSELFDGHQPFDFQLQVAEHLLSGRNVILQAPTGSGKTRAALFPFLHAWQTGIQFPRKCLYAVPLRVLATQFKDDTERQVKAWSGIKPIICQQTGEQQDDPTLESDLIFTTIDQVLSSGLSVPYSLSYRRSNLNAGAVFSSYLICDELHLFPLDEHTGQGALATLIELLSTFQGAIPFLLMTATLSAEILTRLQKELSTALVTVDKEALSMIPSQQKKRRYHTVDTQLNVASVLEKHQSRTLVICNQVERAITFYEEICQTLTNGSQYAGSTEILLLHSRFIKQHRHEKEGFIRKQYADPALAASSIARSPSLIVVSTQAIEVGLDITCEHLHTELAPASSLIQRAGRCARYSGEEGDVFIYQLPADKTNAHLPYSAELCKASWEAFSAAKYNGQPLQFGDEQQIVSTVHNPTDARLFDLVKQESHARWQSMSAALFRGDKTDRSTLIRKVDSRTLIVHDQPEQIQKPYQWQGFSLFHGTLRGWLNRLTDLDGPDVGWYLRYPVEIPDTSEDSRHQPHYDWNHYVTHPIEVDLSPIFVVNPELVAYDQQRGFRLAPAEVAIIIQDLCQEPKQQPAGPLFSMRYRLETYVQHIERMLAFYYRDSILAQQIKLTAKRLASGYSVDAIRFERAVLVAIALHDVGKLQQEWQEWSHIYQERIGDPVRPSVMIAHTNYEPRIYPLHAQVERAIRIPRPHHAAEGACASWAIIVRALDNDEMLSRAVFTAITRHHAPFAVDVEPYTLHPDSQAAIADALALVGIPTRLATTIQMQGRRLPKGTALQNQLIRQDNAQEWLLYALIVRILRLCDGHAVEGA